MTVKADRKNALVYAKEHFWVGLILGSILKSTTTTARADVIVPPLSKHMERWHKQGLHKAHPVVPHKADYKKAKELSKYFELTTCRHGRPAKSYQDLETGALYVFRLTGYVDPKTNSARWVAQCGCGNEIVLSAHQLEHGASYCGSNGCPYKAKKAREAAYPATPVKRDTPEKVDNAADALAHLLTGPVSSEVH